MARRGEPSEADQRWRKWAACLGADPEVFFPTDLGKGHREHLYDEARRICAGCPVNAACLEAGLYERDGCWGGTSPAQRERIRRARRKQARYDSAVPHPTSDGA